ncbi:MAG: peptidoglycan editing factor PgeF [Alphaproteobacteria bacterium]|nr:peptidoglycan editing factor PgeF [Alphaproteobacteria bacterium]
MMKGEALAGLASVAHAFLERKGGVSTGLYAGLNCGFGSSDDRDAVSENRRRARAAIGADRLAVLHQVHSAKAVALTEPPRGLHADGMATDQPGLALGILTADCAPVLFADESAGVVGAAHAGWRGALAGIVEAVLERMEQLGARTERIAAAVGPCIAQASYEVGSGFRIEFEAADPNNARWFVPAERPGHFRFDLAGYVGARLERASLAAVSVARADTCAEETRFYSYRRACLKGEPDYGRQLSLVALSLRPSGRG